MALEKRLPAIAPQLLTSDGTNRGVVSVADASLFKVKQLVSLKNSIYNTEYEVKEVVDLTTLVLGPKGAISSFADISHFKVVDGTFIFANEQKRPSIPFEETTRATYEEEPTVAERVVLVDKMGDKYTTDNPLPVQLSDGSINIGTVEANLEVQLTAKDSDPLLGRIHDSIRIGDGQEELAINPDGSINVVITPIIQPNFIHNEITSVPSGAETLLLSVAGNIEGRTVSNVTVSGDNIAHYRVKLNGNVILNKRTYWGAGMNEIFNFEAVFGILKLTIDDVLTITVEHNRPELGSFEATAVTN